MWNFALEDLYEISEYAVASLRENTHNTHFEFSF